MFYLQLETMDSNATLPHLLLMVFHESVRVIFEYDKTVDIVVYRCCYRVENDANEKVQSI